MSSTQYLSDAATRHAVFLQRYAGGRSKEAISILSRLRRDINARLANEPTAFQAQRLTVALNDIDQLAATAFNEIGGKVIYDARQLADAEAQFSVSLFSKASTVDWVLPSDAVLTAAVMSSQMAVNKGAGITIEDALRNFSTKKRTEIARVITDGVTLGDTTATISSKLAEKINTLQRRQLDALVRTVANNVSSVARTEVYEANSDIIDGYIWIATLDSRTTLICFQEETSVIPLGTLENVFRRKYTGDMITITTASGKKITGTPNHPVLTSSGWLALDELEPRKHVVYSPVFDTVGVSGNDDVGMPTTIGKLYDSLSKLPAFDVELKGSTADDFHGDGKGGDGEVHILRAKGKLSYWVEISLGKLIKYKLLRWIHNCVRLLSGSFLKHHIFSRLPFAKPSKADSGRIESGVDSAFTSPSFRYYFRRPCSRVKHLNNAINFIRGKLFGFASLKAWHHSRLLKHISDCSGCDAVLPAQTAGGLPIPVFADNVISKSVEFKSHHVYNLQSSLGLYIAGGIVVKNCASRDGKVFQSPHGPRPPAHFSCRSTTIPKIKDEYDIGSKLKGQRPAVGAGGAEQVSSRTTYGGWLKKQPVEFVDEALGVERSKLFRSGKLTIGGFIDGTGRVYTLNELERMNPIAMIE